MYDDDEYPLSGDALQDYFDKLDEESEKFDAYLDTMEVTGSVFQVLVPIVFSILLCVGFVGNVIVIRVTLTTHRIIKNPVHSIMVLNMAVADLLYLLSSAPYQMIQYSVSTWIFWPFMCPFLHFLNIQAMSVSIFTMCALAIMRFIGLMKPFKVRKSFITTSPKLTGLVIIILLWSLALLQALPNAIKFRLHGKEEGLIFCRWSDYNEANKFKIALFVTTFCIPLVLVTVLYFVIGREIIWSRKTTNPAVNKQEQLEYKKITIMVLCLLIAFLICWSPHHVHTFIAMANEGNYDSDNALVEAICQVLGFCFSYAHACANPLIYTFAAPGFRKSLYSSCNFKDIHELKKPACNEAKASGRGNIVYTASEIKLLTDLDPDKLTMSSQTSQESNFGKTLSSVCGGSVSDGLFSDVVCENDQQSDGASLA